MIAVGRNGEVELDGRTLTVRAKRGLLQRAHERRIPLGQVTSIEFKSCGWGNGYIYFTTGGGFPDPMFEASYGRGGVVFTPKQEAAFVELRDAATERLEALARGEP